MARSEGNAAALSRQSEWKWQRAVQKWIV